MCPGSGFVSENYFADTLDPVQEKGHVHYPVVASLGFELRSPGDDKPALIEAPGFRWICEAKDCKAYFGDIEFRYCPEHRCRHHELHITNAPLCLNRRCKRSADYCFVHRKCPTVSTCPAH